MSDRELRISKPPLSILMNPSELKKKKPWEIDLSQLLDLFGEFLDQVGNRDLRLCANAALSSALIYRLKVETFFLFEKLRSEKPHVGLGEPPEIVSLPFRYELYSTSLVDLLDSLRSVIEGVVARKDMEMPKARRIEPTVELDTYFEKIQEMLEPFRIRIMDAIKDGGEVLLSRLSRGLGALDSTRTFILLLFLAMEGLVSLEQQGDDIRIAETANITD